MKKFISVLSVTAIIFCSFSVTAFAAETKNKKTTEDMLLRYEAFDSDCDGAYSTTSDARETLEIALGIKAPTEERNYDADGNGVVDSRDALKVLKVATGIEGVFSKEELVPYLCEELNAVKSDKPGCYLKKTDVCSSMAVTTTGYPVSKLNVKNMEYADYLKVNKEYIEQNKVLIVISEGLDYYNSTIKEIDAQIAVAESVYTPQVSERNIPKGTSSHYLYFPVNSNGWSCKLTAEDVKNIDLVYENGEFVITVNMDEYNYSASEYPFAESKYGERAQLPYGKAFNLPTSKSSDLSGFNGLTLKNGKIVVKVDVSTGAAVYADYYYDYIITAYSQQSFTSGNKTYTVKATINEFASSNENFTIKSIA